MSNFFWENKQNETLSTFICPTSTFDLLCHFGHVLPFCSGKNSILSFKNFQKYVNYRKHKKDYMYIF